MYGAPIVSLTLCCLVCTHMYFTYIHISPFFTISLSSLDIFLAIIVSFGEAVIGDVFNASDPIVCKYRRFPLSKWLYYDWYNYYAMYTVYSVNVVGRMLTANFCYC